MKRAFQLLLVDGWADLSLQGTPKRQHAQSTRISGAYTNTMISAMWALACLGLSQSAAASA